MKRVFRNEIKKFIFSPIIIGFFFIPIILFLIVNISLNNNTASALVATTFVQIVMVTLFGFGMKLKVYQNETLNRKIENSQFKKYQYLLPITIMYLFVLVLTLLPVYIIGMILKDSLGYIDRHQIDYLTTTPSTSLETGLDQDYLLFNSTLLTFAQFIYAIFFVSILSFATAYFGTRISKDENRYLVFSIIVFIIIITTSGLFTKELYILSSGDLYTKDSAIIKNKTYSFIRHMSPFYWAYQLLASTIIADKNLGILSYDNVPQELVEHSIPFYLSFDYYNIFHVGINYPDSIDMSDYSRPLLLDNVEPIQLMIVAYVPTFGTMLFSVLVIEEVIN